MTTPTFTTPPDTPSRAEPSTFSAKADAFVTYFTTLQGELVTGTAWFNSTASTVAINAGLAQAASISALAVANAEAWVSAAAYSQYDAVFSTVDYQTYRAKTTHTGETTDPSSDTTNWEMVLPVLLPDPTHSTTTGAAQTVDFSNEYQTVDAASPVTTLTFSSTSAVQDVNVLVDLYGTGPELADAYYDNVIFYTDSVDLSAEAITLSTDGTKMYVLGLVDDKVYQYTLATAFDLSTASYDNISVSVAAQDLNCRDIGFSADGTKMYAISNNSVLFQYTLTTAFDLSTASYSGISFSTASEDGSMRSFDFSPDGTKMLAFGKINKKVFRYNLSTAFNISTASYANNSSPAITASTGGRGMRMSADGTKFFFIDSYIDTVTQWTMSSAFLPSSATDDGVSLVFSGYSSDNFEFSADGTKMYVADNFAGGKIQQYTTAIPYSLVLPTNVTGNNISPKFGFNSYKFATVDSGATYFIAAKAEGLRT